MKIIDYIWCQPQTIVGYILYKYITKNIVKKEIYKNTIAIEHNKRFGVSLGKYIFYSTYSSNKENTKKHEYGHYLQNKMYGPLYLIIVGIPSVITNLLSKKYKYIKDTYYTRWPENNADKLGNVKRK